MASKKAVKERRFRQKEQERKHFEGPMRKFIEQKYPLIYEEYRAFYEALIRNHPNARDLSKTCTYKTWLSSLKQQAPSDILATALRQALGQEETDINHDENGESADIQNDDRISEEENGEDSSRQSDDQCEAPEATTFTLTDNEREQETGQASNVLIDINDLADIMETVDAEVESIMDELARDEALAAILNRPEDHDLDEPHDEGIEIDPLEDIDVDLDVQPFDYTLEVENDLW